MKLFRENSNSAIGTSEPAYGLLECAAQISRFRRGAQGLEQRGIQPEASLHRRALCPRTLGSLRSVSDDLRGVAKRHATPRPDIHHEVPRLGLQPEGRQRFSSIVDEQKILAG